MAEGMAAPTIPAPKPRDEFLRKFLRETFFLLLITIITAVQKSLNKGIKLFRSDQ